MSEGLGSEYSQRKAEVEGAISGASLTPRERAIALAAIAYGHSCAVHEHTYDSAGMIVKGNGFRKDLEGICQRLGAQSKAILIADDDMTTRHMLAGIMRDELGYEALEAADGLEALRIIQEKIPGLVFLDNSMPKMSGAEVLAAVRANPETRGIYVIGIGAAFEAKDIPALDEYIPKFSSGFFDMMKAAPARILGATKGG